MVLLSFGHDIKSYGQSRLAKAEWGGPVPHVGREEDQRSDLGLDCPLGLCWEAQVFKRSAKL